MRIEHLAIWVTNLEEMKSFYEQFFQATAGQRYHNPKKQFTSYFLTFARGGRLELMHRPDIGSTPKNRASEGLGIAHFAVSVGSETEVNALTQRLENKGFSVIGRPRWTGDGYYESVILDPEGNRVEITI